MGIVGIRCVLDGVDKVDSIVHCGKVFFVECTSYEASYVMPVAFWLGKYGACTDRCTLSVALLSTVPTLVRTNGRHSWHEQIGVLLIWF